MFKLAVVLKLLCAAILTGRGVGGRLVKAQMTAQSSVSDSRGLELTRAICIPYKLCCGEPHFENH